MPKVGIAGQRLVSEAPRVMRPAPEGKQDLGSVINPNTDRWLWSPDLGRYSLAYGLPQVPAYFEAAAHDAPATSRYDYWREIAYYSFDADPLPHDEARTFIASGQCLMGAKANLLAYKSRAVTGRGIPAAFADDRESYLIGVVLRGQRHYSEDADTFVSSKAGKFFVFDNRSYSRVVWSNHSAIHLSLPRLELERVLGGQIPPPQVMCQLLEASRMATALKSQMRMTAAQLAGANDAERAFLLGQLTQLAFFTCEAAAADLLSPKASSSSDLLSAALQLIEQDLTNPGLNVARLQQQLGCSRATLYRAFAKTDMSVLDAIWEMRVQRAKAMLASAPEVPTSLVATRCGWHDGSSFARAFRRWVGMTPSEYREELRRA